MRKPKAGDLVRIRESLTYGDPPLLALRGKLVRIIYISPINGVIDVCTKSSFNITPQHYTLVTFIDYYKQLTK